MSKLRAAVLIALVALGAASWYAFRPERALVDTAVHEASPSQATSVLLEGNFKPVAHKGRGRVQIVRLTDGSQLVRFTSFETLNGPDVRVYLLGDSSVNDRSELAKAGHLDLGALKGNVGDQNYLIPSDVDVSRFRAVSVWCRRFGVNFTTAALRPLSSAGS